ncbi:MAG: 30S ribosomal protein S15 [Deltaproteobacteria bacterium]|nr:MAG: 30S ribosomal protein S15 [Deltaproteobacteria bacterium]
MHYQIKQSIITKLQSHPLDTGSPEVQIGLLSSQITILATHFKYHPKDHHSRRGLLKMLSRRRSLLKYLSSTNLDRYFIILSKLGLRK